MVYKPDALVSGKTRILLVITLDGWSFGVDNILGVKCLRI